MKGDFSIDLFGILTSAVGGRAFAAMLWISWLLAAVIAHYIQDFVRSDAVGGRSFYAFGLVAAATLFHAVRFSRALLSEKQRVLLFAKRSDLPQVRLPVRLAVWIIPVLALGAAIAPAILR